jgi:putative peptidoglycan lipid II flippase
MSEARRITELPLERSATESLLPAAARRFRQLSRGYAATANRRIFAAMVTVGAFSLAVKLAATLKEVVVAHRFGVSDNLDAFLIAYVLPSFAINVIAGSFNSALIPTFIQVREREGEMAAQRLFSTVLVWSAALLTALSALLALAAPYLLPVIASGFTAEKLALTRSLFFILLPMLPLSGIATIWAAILNAGERFALAAITPIIRPLAVMLAVIEFSERAGVYALAAAVVAGAALECALLARGLKQRAVSIRPRWHGLSPAVKQVMKQYAPMIAAAAAMSSAPLVDQSMAAMLGAGSVSALGYGNRTATVVVSLCSIALSTAVLPQFSRMVAAGDWRGLRHTIKTYTRLILLATIPLTVALVLLARPLVSLLFERGAFTREDVIQVAAVERLYALQLPFYVLGMLFVPLISALKANSVLMWGTVISFTLNIILDYALMRWMGLPGIALATSIVYMVGLIYKAAMSARLLKKAIRAG